MIKRSKNSGEKLPPILRAIRHDRVMSDVDRLQQAEEEVAQMQQEESTKLQQEQAAELEKEPIKKTASLIRRSEKIKLKDLGTIPNIRTNMGDIYELALSIHQRGLIAPLVVRENEEQKYEVIAGRRRLEALRMLHEGEIEVPCEVIEGVSDAETYEIMLLENVQRQQLQEIEEARSLRSLLDLNPELHAKDLAHSLGKSSSWISGRLRLLDLPQNILDLLDKGDLTFTVADMLRKAQAADLIDEDEAEEIAEEAVASKMTSRQVQARIKPIDKTEAFEENWQAPPDRIEGDELVLTAEDAQYDNVENSPAIISEGSIEQSRQGPTPRQIELYAICRLAMLVPQKERGPIAVPDDKMLPAWSASLENADVEPTRIRIAATLYRLAGSKEEL